MLADTWIYYSFCGCVLALPLAGYIRWQARREGRARDAAAKGELLAEGPRGQHPHIDVSYCIGCQGCTSVCPEGGVLGMIGGKAAVVKPQKCIGHGLCVDACPVGAIRLVTAAPALGANLPYLTPEFETSIPNLFIAGELGGLALIRNAVHQGRDCIDTIAQRLTTRAKQPRPGYYDVLIVGAGPAGISASLRAIEQKLNYLTLERDTIGGTVSNYPRQKLVMTSTIQFPLSAPLKKSEVSKENLLSFWAKITDRDDFRVHVQESVERIEPMEDGTFVVSTSKASYHARAVVLAMGRSGSPKKLGIKGEGLPKVMYRLLEADHYVNKDILVVGGGDSAVEAAMGLALQKGNRVTLSYRKGEFSRIKDRNARRLHEFIRNGKLRVIFNSSPVEFREGSATLEIAGEVEKLPNDFVWIFAGGTAPNDFLKQIGIQFGLRDLTLEAVQEAHRSTLAS